MRKIVIITIFSVLATFINFAAAAERVDFENPSYLFHLYYDNDQLFADRDFEFTYDVIPEEYVAEAVTTQFPFRGEIINLRGEAVKTFQFDPRRGNPNFLKGKISVKAPYVPDGQKVVFYDSQENPLLTIFVSESSFCNDDGVCNSDKGEDEKNCSNDCRGTPAPTPPVSEEGGLSGITLAALIVSALVLAGAGGWYAWRRWRKVKYIQESE